MYVRVQGKVTASMWFSRSEAGGLGKRGIGGKRGIPGRMRLRSVRDTGYDRGLGTKTCEKRIGCLIHPRYGSHKFHGAKLRLLLGHQ